MIRPQAEILEIMDIFNQKDPNPRCELITATLTPCWSLLFCRRKVRTKALIGQPKNCSKSPTRRKKW